MWPPGVVSLEALYAVIDLKGDMITMHPSYWEYSME